MRNDERFEIERAFDLLPHVVGSSWASVWFRMKGNKHPTREEFREKTIEYLKMMEPIFEFLSKRRRVLQPFASTLILEKMKNMRK